MGFYQRLILPSLIDLAMRHPAASRRRAEVVPGAAGRVLEVGIGSGLNLPFYSGRVTHLCGVDPSPELLAMSSRKAGGLPFPVELLCRSGEDLPLRDQSVDTVVMTWTLCSIPDAVRALGEVRRVLRPCGKLLFIEHGLAPDPAVRRWQHRLTPFWKRLAGGCHLDRRVDALLLRAGFVVEDLRADYLPGPRPMTYTYQGLASPGRLPILTARE